MRIPIEDEVPAIRTINGRRQNEEKQWTTRDLQDGIADWCWRHAGVDVHFGGNGGGVVGRSRDQCLHLSTTNRNAADTTNVIVGSNINNNYNKDGVWHDRGADIATTTRTTTTLSSS